MTCSASQTATFALYLAPMAGLTHSAFRRLVADFGGYSALFTEMLSGSAVIREDMETSTYTRKRVTEGRVIYQLLLNGEEDMGAILEKIKHCNPAGIDLNLGCPAPEIRKRAAGFMLFCDMPQLEKVLDTLRKNWSGSLSVKCRLGKNTETWRTDFIERVCLFERYGISAITLHPRFSDEKLRRIARWSEFSWAASQTSIPVIANGDIISRAQIENRADDFSMVKGIMLGRIAVIKPWIFKEFSGDPISVDYHEVFRRFVGYVKEDFVPEKVLGRIKEFTAYYSRNFFFGHELFSKTRSVGTVEACCEAADDFLSRNPRLAVEPSITGI